MGKTLKIGTRIWGAFNRHLSWGHKLYKSFLIIAEMSYFYSEIISYIYIFCPQLSNNLCPQITRTPLKEKQNNQFKSYRVASIVDKQYISGAAEAKDTVAYRLRESTVQKFWSLKLAGTCNQQLVREKMDRSEET